MGTRLRNSEILIGTGTAALLVVTIPRQLSPAPLLLAALFLLLICLTDTFRGKIPNIACLTVILCAFGWHTAHSGWFGIQHSGLGLVTGFGLLLVPYLLGGMGAGDVKALAALGAVLGSVAVFQVFLYGGLAGGILAILYLAVRKGPKGLFESASKALLSFRLFLCTRDPRLLRPKHAARADRFPYATAFALGFIAKLQWGDLVRF